VRRDKKDITVLAIGAFRIRGLKKIEPLLCARIAKRSRSSAAAQFEREVIGERIRDKVRGLPQEGHVDRWMGWY
jgi:DNA invertase Pin-like site-specific DNA recombinase